MMNEKLFETYKGDILTLFKAQFKKLATKNIDIRFQEVFKATMEELGLETLKSDQDYLKQWFHRINSLQFIEELLLGLREERENLNEIILHSPKRAQLLFNELRIEKKLSDLDLDDYQLALEILALRNNISWNYADPFASFSIHFNEVNYRVTLIHYSTSANGLSKAFFRVIKTELPTLELFNLNESEHLLIKSMMTDKKNILVSGSTGSGKTTFLRALLKESDELDHTIILEDTHEILPTSPHQTTMLAQSEVLKKTLKDYCAYALRMSPDRVIVGEMRSTEVVPFMLAMNTGHKGLLSTIHANSCIDAISRIALLFSLYSENKELDFALITKLACKNIDYVIHMENKKVKEIARIIGSEGESVFYETIFSRD